MSIRQHDFTIERHFHQSPAQTFQAFGDPDLRRRWFRVPESWTDTEWSLDFRIGGGEVNAGRDQRGTRHLFRSRFHDITDGERIVFAYDMLLDDRLTSVSLTTVELHPGASGGTHRSSPSTARSSTTSKTRPNASTAPDCCWTGSSPTSPPR